MDRRIGRQFLNAGIGYGGSCFPKDVAAFIHISDQLGVPFTLLKEVQRINAVQRNRFLKLIRDTLWVLREKKIAVWGVTFKPDTDDVRSSVAIELVDAMLREGAHVTVYDPKGMDKAREWKGVADAKFAALSDRGQVTMPLGRTFFARRFGMAVDRFGISWMVIVPAEFHLLSFGMPMCLDHFGTEHGAWPPGRSEPIAEFLLESSIPGKLSFSALTPLVRPGNRESPAADSALRSHFHKECGR